MNNMDVYNAGRAVPQEAQKPIQGGRLKGMTDINPMWRIKKLTELYGPCGIGWWYTIDKQWLEPGGNDEISAFCDITLHYVYDGKVSNGIPGTGGSAYVTQERNGIYTSNECYKQALTDALGVACKALGIGADVYWQKDPTKYSAPAHVADQQPGTRQMATPAQREYIIQHIDDRTYADATRAFGTDLETMSYKQAEKLITRIKEDGVNA